MNLPADNFILLSVVNTALRDRYGSFSEFVEEEDADGVEISARLADIGFTYDPVTNSFK